MAPGRAFGIPGIGVVQNGTMCAGDALTPDDEQLLPLVIALADGTPVDWPPVPPPLLKQLQQLERLVRAHEATRSSPSGDRAGLTHETLLTEARRKAAGLEHPLRVDRGPLVVHEKIGRGSFGDVYRAWDPRLDREVALKLIPEDNSASAASPVVEEGRLLARVRHPNIMIVHGAERIEGRVGIWTEYIRGETLASEVARRGPLSAEEAVRIGADVCAALGAVHAAGLLHRDVKAQNILRDASGRIVLGDFGTGIEIAEDAGVSDPQVAGTPLYLAPEVIEGQPATVGSDLYGVGVLLYFLVSGTYPVRGRTLAEIKRAHARTTARLRGRRAPICRRRSCRSSRRSSPPIPTTAIKRPARRKRRCDGASSNRRQRRGGLAVGSRQRPLSVRWCSPEYPPVSSGGIDLTRRPTAHGRVPQR